MFGKTLKETTNSGNKNADEKNNLGGPSLESSSESGSNRHGTVLNTSRALFEASSWTSICEPSGNILWHYPTLSLCIRKSGKIGVLNASIFKYSIARQLLVHSAFFYLVYIPCMEACFCSSAFPPGHDPTYLYDSFFLSIYVCFRKTQAKFHTTQGQHHSYANSLVVQWDHKLYFDGHNIAQRTCYQLLSTCTCANVISPSPFTKIFPSPRPHQSETRTVNRVLSTYNLFMTFVKEELQCSLYIHYPFTNFFSPFLYIC